MEITANTRLLGIFGHPINHTLSPLMHNAAIEALRLNMVYLPFSVKPSRLGDAINSIRALGMVGVNITIPYKETVMEFLDELSDGAVTIGAVNTILNREGRLIGYNTDGEGYIMSLKEETGFEPEGKFVMIIGAGGAARGILSSLAMEHPASVVIANRTLSKAISLADEFKEKFPHVEFKVVSLSSKELRTCMRDTRLLINATSVGMEGRGRLELPIEELPDGTVVSDIVYKPLMTGLLRMARGRGLIVHGGLGMLIHQGALSFRLWTSLNAPIGKMRLAVEKALKA